jgi:hypothetical protein
MLNPNIVAGPKAPSVVARAIARGDEPSVAALAAAALVTPSMAIKAIEGATDAGRLLRQLARVAPGAVEALWRCDEASRAFRRDALEALEAAGFVILS